jgi:hypothetical protein
MKEGLIAQIAFRIVHIAMNPTKIPDGIRPTINLRLNVVDLSGFPIQSPPSNCTYAMLPFPESSKFNGFFKLVGSALPGSANIAGTVVEESTLVIQTVPFGHFYVIIRVFRPFFVFLLDGRGIFLVVSTATRLAMNRCSVATIAVFREFTHRTFHVALGTPSHRVVCRSFVLRPLKRRLDAFPAIRGASIWPPLIAVKIGQPKRALAGVADFRLLLILAGIERLALIERPGVLAGLAPSILAIGVASVVMKIVQRTTDFTSRTGLHSEP